MMNLSVEQNQVIKLVQKDKNVFMTGPGGTGKSYLIDFICSMYPTKKIQICALTGCAAELLTNASTIHRWAGTGLSNGDKQGVINRVIRKKQNIKKWKQTDILIIDEVSMMSLKYFETLDLLGKTIRNNGLPFGGIQLIFSGDFYQLPPVGNESDPDSCKFCFESPLWNQTFSHVVVLKHIFRQTDPVFSKILRQIRRGGITEKSHNILKERIMNKDNKKDLSYGKELNPPLILPLKEAVKHINDNNMNKLDTPLQTYDYKIVYTKDYIQTNKKVIDYEINHLKKIMNAELSLQLKKGAHVMCVANIDMEGSNKIVNGSQGIVTDIINDIPIVRFKNGVTKLMTHHSWMSEDIEGLGIQQIPLILSWAITIHKSQGITLDSAIIDAGNNIFECGQIYVALSRLKSLQGLFLGEFNHHRIMTNPKVIEYYSSL